jgi:hypothetical protein
MLADPLRYIGLGSHCALLQRSAPGKLKVRLVAIHRRGDGTYGYDELYQVHVNRPLSGDNNNTNRNVRDLPKFQRLQPSSNSDPARRSASVQIMSTLIQARRKIWSPTHS